MNIAVFPGSFDPITIGHYDLIKRAMPLFDKIIVAVGTNSTKSSLFPLEERLGWLKIVFKDYPKISIDHFEGLTAHYCIKVHANFLIRGLRNSSDFDYEKTISQVNQIISHGIETVFLISNPQYSHISSTIVREVIKGNGNVEPFLPKGVVILMSNE
ncbi:MAG: pantetheine-phosphate adenylyltransferase [Saprospiraceae bacterium]|nr:pantetheine-phosphate adenylyltransferase [Candidatus Brachybacter algidus]